MASIEHPLALQILHFWTSSEIKMRLFVPRPGKSRRKPADAGVAGHDSENKNDGVEIFRGSRQGENQASVLPRDRRTDRKSLLMEIAKPIQLILNFGPASMGLWGEAKDSGPAFPAEKFVNDILGGSQKGDGVFLRAQRAGKFSGNVRRLHLGRL